MNKISMGLIVLTIIVSASYAKTTCGQFKTWKEAEAYYKAKKSGYKALDRNNDGKPCEKLWAKSLDKKEQATRIRIYKYGNPASFGKSFSSMSACEKERHKLTKANAGTDYSYIPPQKSRQQFLKSNSLIIFYSNSLFA